jgi:hypothetical protein
MEEVKEEVERKAERMYALEKELKDIDKEEKGNGRRI